MRVGPTMPSPPSAWSPVPYPTETTDAPASAPSAFSPPLRTRPAPPGRAGAVPEGDHRCTGQRLVGVLLADAHEDRPAAVDLADELEHGDLLLERLEQRPQAAGEVDCGPGEARRPADDQPVLPRLDQRLDQGGAGRGDPRPPGRRGGRR